MVAVRDAPDAPSENAWNGDNVNASDTSVDVATDSDPDVDAGEERPPATQRPREADDDDTNTDEACDNEHRGQRCSRPTFSRSQRC